VARAASPSDSASLTQRIAQYSAGLVDGSLTTARTSRTRVLARANATRARIRRKENKRKDQCLSSCFRLFSFIFCNRDLSMTCGQKNHKNPLPSQLAFEVVAKGSQAAKLHLSLSSARPDHYDNVFYHTYEPANEKEISRIPSSENNEPTLADSARKTGGPRRAQRQA
jgi:hypothetical protein